jgi:hypothetical protein
MTLPRRKPLDWLFVGVLAVILLAMWGRQIDDSPIISDAVQSLQMGVNFERHGIFSLDAAPPLTPTNFREPLVPAASALAIEIIDAITGKSPPESYFSGKRLQYLKYQNLFWLSLLSVGTFWVARSLTSSFYVGLIAVILINVRFRPHYPPGLIDDLMTEIPSAGMLIVASGALAIAFSRRSPALYVLSGFMFGVLTLTKAVALYVFIVVVAVLACLYLMRRAMVSFQVVARDLALLIVPFLCVVAPWMIRNHVQLGTYEITQRAGFALEERSLEDQMSAQEYVGAFYLWAPAILQNRLGAWLGFSQNDLLAGGRLQRLDDNPDSALSQTDLPFEEAGRPDKAVTFFRRGRAELRRLKMGFRAAGRPFPDVDQDATAKKNASTVILSHPWRHLALTVLLLWRASAVTTPILIGTLVFAIWQRRYDLLLFVLPSLGIVAAYALTSPFVGRYDLPMHLVAILLLPIIASLGLKMWLDRHQNAQSSQAA